MNRKQENQELKVQHLEALRKLGFIGSFRTLRMYENRAYLCAEKWASDSKYSEIIYDIEITSIRYKVQKLFAFGNMPKGFYVNSDPRGSALKLNCNEVERPIEGMEKDWGGDYILAPDFN
jgi:hypothetical protein